MSTFEIAMLAVVVGIALFGVIVGWTIWASSREN